MNTSSTIAIYLILCWLVGFGFGTNRTLGPWRAMAYAILLTPLIGLIITLNHKTKDRNAFDQQQRELQKKQLEVLNETNSKIDSDLTLKLERLQKMKHAGDLSEDEFQIAKSKLLD